MSSAIKTPAFQAKAGNIQNEDGSSIYSGGEWSFKNASAVARVTITDAGAVTLGPSGFTGNHVVNGNVGIGTASPQAALHINRGTAGAEVLRLQGGGGAFNDPFMSFYRSDGLARNGYIQVTPTDFAIGLHGSGNILFSSNSAERMRIDASGILTSLPTYNNGSASAANMVVNSSGTFLRSVSALKYKQDIRDLESININNFRPVRYKSKCAGDDQTTDYFGIVADEVDAAGIKELVSYSADGEVEGFQYDRLAVVLVKAIQELSAKVDAQAEEIKALKAQP